MPTYRTIHTLYGLQRLAAAEATGVPINLVEMAVGDGNGNPTTPSEAQTQLVRELFRATVNSVAQDPDDPLMFVAELVIPVAVGGFTIRECGIFDSEGGLFAVANVPDTYKPTAAEGAYADTVVRMRFKVANANNVTILADPNVVLATRTWVINTITPGYMIPDGTTSQVLTKDSNADGDYSWQDPNVADVVVDVIEEKQTLAAAQTTVILATVTTRGLAVYIEGVRISEGVAADEWQEDAVDPDTKIVLGQSYPDGTKILLTQNEPTGAVPFPLIRDQNLADVPDKALARTNLGAYSKAEADAAGQPGDVKYTARNTAPTGWLKANGAAVNRVTYAALFAAIGTTFGAGDGFNTFNLPDLRGEFLRGWDDGRGVDTGRAFGSAQSSANLAHVHGVTVDAVGNHTHITNIPVKANGFGAGPFAMLDGNQPLVGTQGQVSDAAGAHTHTASAASSGGTEARPRNIALLACIKF